MSDTSTTSVALFVDIVPDGRCLAPARDPPGQRSNYIPPGSTVGRILCNNTDTNSCQFRNVSATSLEVNNFENFAVSSNVPRRNSPSNAAIAVSTQSSIAIYTNDSPTSNNNRHPTSQHPSEEEQRNLKAMFPCLNPINPHMREAHSRLQTFLDNPGTWPAHRIRASPQEIVDAGRYYLGEKDCVKCWYCNGGLQNWDRDDNPWEEHAKYYEKCEYVLQQKGPSFVHDIVARFPNLRKPVLYNPSTTSAATAQLREVQSGPRLSENKANCVNGAPEIIDPGKNMREWKRKTDEDMRSSELVSLAREMGFEDAAIKEVITRKYETSNQKFSSFESLVEALVALPDEDIPNGSNEEDTTYAEDQSSPLSTSDLSTTAGV